jgi:hypothetical protein
MAVAVAEAEATPQWWLDAPLCVPPCTDEDCFACAAAQCPSKEPLHNHHDGCPACDGPGPAPDPFNNACPNGQCDADRLTYIDYSDQLYHRPNGWECQSCGSFIPELPETRGAFIETAVLPERLLASDPPKFSDRNKLAMFALAKERLESPLATSKSMRIRRCFEPIWPKDAEKRQGGFRLEITQTGYDYPAPNSGETHWHVNFADPALFFGYGGPLFAQDEVQTAEHPHLGSVREIMKRFGATDNRWAPKTCERDAPTPVLITDVPRMWNVRDLYGNVFPRTPLEKVLPCFIPLDGCKQLSNIIAMSSLQPSRPGTPYTLEQIHYLFHTAHIAFSHAVHMSPVDRKLVIHTGNWGCGAFGGNKLVAALTQIMAARLAGVDELIYHTYDRQSFLILVTSDDLLRRTDLTLPRVEALKLVWGAGDGN